MGELILRTGIGLSLRDGGDNDWLETMVHVSGPLQPIFEDEDDDDDEY